MVILTFCSVAARRVRCQLELGQHNQACWLAGHRWLWPTWQRPDFLKWTPELRRLGVAGAILHRKTLTANKLVQAISLVLKSPTMVQNAESIGKVLAEEDGTANAVLLIEQIFMDNINHASKHP